MWLQWIFLIFWSDTNTTPKLKTGMCTVEGHLVTSYRHAPYCGGSMCIPPTSAQENTWERERQGWCSGCPSTKPIPQERMGRMVLMHSNKREEIKEAQAAEWSSNRHVLASTGVVLIKMSHTVWLNFWSLPWHSMSKSSYTLPAPADIPSWKWKVCMVTSA